MRVTNNINQTQKSKQNFGMALKRPFPSEVNKYITARFTNASDKYMIDAIEEVTKAQRKNKKFDIITEIEKKDKQNFLAHVINNKTKQIIKTFSQSKEGNAGEVLIKASEDATLRDTLNKRPGLFSKLISLIK